MLAYEANMLAYIVFEATQVTSGLLRYIWSMPPSALQMKLKIPLLKSNSSHGPCWKLALSSVRLLLRSCLAMAKC